jgi:type II secretion system protein N
MTVNWAVWKPRLLYGGFALVAFVLSLRWTFPTEAVKERVMFEAGRRGWQVEMDRLGPSGVLGLRADGLTLEDRSGLKLSVERLDAGLRVLPLLLGKRVLTLDAVVLDGRVTGSAELSGATRHVSATLSGLDAARAAAMRNQIGPALGGRLGGTFELELPYNGDAPDLTKATGRVDLSMAAATVSGQLPLPGFTGGLPLPRVPLGAVTLAVKLDQGRAAVERLETKGGDVELSTEGLSVALQQRLEFAALSGRARLHLAPSFWQQPATKDLKPLADAALMQSKISDGTYQFQVAGTLGRPQLTPGAHATPGGVPSSGGE